MGKKTEITIVSFIGTTTRLSGSILGILYTLWGMGLPHIYVNRSLFSSYGNAG